MIEDIKDYLEAEEPEALDENLKNLLKLKEFCLDPFRKSFKCVDLNEEFVAVSENTMLKTELEKTFAQLTLFDTQKASLTTQTEANLKTIKSLKLSMEEEKQRLKPPTYSSSRYYSSYK
jgi:hypothetical protein